MGFFGGGGGGQKASPPAAVFPTYTGLNLMTSCEALPVPLVYGFTKVSANFIDQGNFTQTAHYTYVPPTSGSGGIFGVGGSSGAPGYYTVSSYTYSVDLCLALCEGPITNIGQVWVNSNVFLFPGGVNPLGWTLQNWAASGGKGGPATAGISLFTGAQGQLGWSRLSGLAYNRLAYLAFGQYQLGTGNTVGSLNFEVAGIGYGTGANGIDADPAIVIRDFLTDPAHGVPGFSSAYLDSTTLFGASGDSSVQTYCAALGLCFSPALIQQESASSVLTRWCQLFNLGAVWSGGKLRFIPYGDMKIIGPTKTFVPNVAPIYALTVDQLAPSGADRMPVTVEIDDPLTKFNVQRIEVLNRAGVNVAEAEAAVRIAADQAQLITLLSHGIEPGQGSVAPVQGQPQYESTPIEARDLNAAGIYGIRIASTVTAHEICDLNVASIVVQTLLQRGLYIQKRFTFTVSAIFCLLDPMDIVSLTDASMDLVGVLVRITGVEEMDDLSLKIEAEEFVVGVSTPGPNPTTGSGSTAVNKNVAAQGVNASLIYQPPAAATNGASSLLVAASGGTGATPDPNFGGANVLVSLDGGSSYSQVGQVPGATPIGSLTANLASASGWDTTNTLSVNLAESGGLLVSTTAGNAQAGVTNIALVGSEIIGFETATLTGANAYGLTNLQRGLFGTTAAAHLSGVQFTLLSKAATVGLPTAWVGVHLYLKLQSFNTFGNGVQDLAACTAIPFTPSASGLPSSQVNTVTQTLSLSSGSSATTTTAQIPAGAYLLGVDVVLSAVAGPTSVKVDPQYLASGSAGGTSGAYGSATPPNGSMPHYATGGTVWTTASGIKLTAVGGAFTGGSAQVSITYLTL